ncbi:hypothetical protein ACS0TY_033725 [Phlomoides rotata]
MIRANLEGVGPATTSVILAAYAPDLIPFMSDEAMVVVLGDSEELFVDSEIWR